MWVLHHVPTALLNVCIHQRWDVLVVRVRVFFVRIADILVAFRLSKSISIGSLAVGVIPKNPVVREFPATVDAPDDNLRAERHGSIARKLCNLPKAGPEFCHVLPR